MEEARDGHEPVPVRGPGGGEGGGGGGALLACGMESGSVFFHDLTMPGRGGRLGGGGGGGGGSGGGRGGRGYVAPPHGSVRLGREPVLGLDSVPSTGTGRDAVVAVAGCAGDADELAALGMDDPERRTVAVIRATVGGGGWGAGGGGGGGVRARVRARAPTCEVGEGSAGGRPGVNVCRFRDDGRVFAVGGWDRRLRIFGRGTAGTAVGGGDVGGGAASSPPPPRAHARPRPQRHRRRLGSGRGRERDPGHWVGGRTDIPLAGVPSHGSEA